VALVGYTNAGKSTLFNRLTEAQVYAADQLFATLDPTLRRLDLAPHQSVILADTVGFIRDLPHELIAAFKATLTETREAALLLHLIDASDPERDPHIRQVEGVLEEIGAGEVPVWRIYNKVDLLPSADADDPARFGADALWLSAVTGAGVAELEQRLARHFTETMFHGWVSLPAASGRLRSRLFAEKAVEAEQTGAGGVMHLRLHLPERSLRALLREAGLDEDPEALRIGQEAPGDDTADHAALAEGGRPGPH
jgi:GTPase